jgi:hypothetical protein
MKLEYVIEWKVVAELVSLESKLHPCYQCSHHFLEFKTPSKRLEEDGGGGGGGGR